VPSSAASAANASRKWSGSIVIAAVFIVLAPAAISVVQSLLPGLRGGDCKAVTPVVTSEVTTGNTLTCNFGIADAVTIRRSPTVERQIAAYLEQMCGSAMLLPLLAFALILLRRG